MFNNSEEVLKYISDEKVEYHRHPVLRPSRRDAAPHRPRLARQPSILEDGVAFDGSSVRGFQAINESDMALFADPATAGLDPFRKHKTLNINFFVHDPITREPYSRDPRNIARKAEEYLAASGIADTCYFGAEAEFYIFDSVRFGSDPHETLPPHRLGRGLVEHRPRRGRAATSATRSTTRAATSRCRRSTTTPTCATTWSPNLIGDGLRGRARPPRGRHRGPGRDQLQVQHAAARRGRAHAVQVHRQEHRLGSTARPPPSCPSRCSATTARACTPTSRCGRTASRCSTTSPATAASPTRPATTSAACCTTRRACWRSPTRR